MVRVREMLESLKIVRQVIDQMPSGDPNEAMPRRVRPPQGDVYMRTESPRGKLVFTLSVMALRNPSAAKGAHPALRPSAL